MADEYNDNGYDDDDDMGPLVGILIVLFGLVALCLSSFMADFINSMK